MKDFFDGRQQVVVLFSVFDAHAVKAIVQAGVIGAGADEDFASEKGFRQGHDAFEENVVCGAVKDAKSKGSKA